MNVQSRSGPNGCGWRVDRIEAQSAQLRRVGLAQRKLERGVAEVTADDDVFDPVARAACRDGAPVRVDERTQGRCDVHPGLRLVHVFLL